MTWSSGDCAVAGLSRKSPIAPAHERDAANKAVVERTFLLGCIRILRKFSDGQTSGDERHGELRSTHRPSAKLEDQSDLGPQLPGRTVFGPKCVVVGADEKIDRQL